MQKIRYALAAGAALFLVSATAQSQILQRTATPRTTSPIASVPAGMCRIWIEGLPVSRQPAPTDCNTARARVPANGRIIYGSNTQGSVYGNTGQYDPRRDSRNGQYDPRRDPRNGQYDPRLDRSSSRYDRRYDDDYNRRAAKIREQYQRKQQREREQYERKMQKEREKEWKKSHQGKGHDDHHDRDHDDHHDRGHDGDHH